MFIDPTMEVKVCPPAKRDVSGDDMPHRPTFRSSGSRRSLLEMMRSISPYATTELARVTEEQL